MMQLSSFSKIRPTSVRIGNVIELWLGKKKAKHRTWWRKKKITPVMCLIVSWNIIKKYLLIYTELLCTDLLLKSWPMEFSCLQKWTRKPAVEKNTTKINTTCSVERIGLICPFSRMWRAIHLHDPNLEKIPGLLGLVTMDTSAHTLDPQGLYWLCS